MSAALLQPEILFHGRYRVTRCIRESETSAVYEVCDSATSGRRALKVILASLAFGDELRARFAIEARVAGTIESDHIVRTFDAGVEPKARTPFLVMELLRGEDLGALARRRGGLPAQELVLYLFQTALALERTHQAGIIHRNIKPDNLFATVRDDGSPCVKVLGFGAAKLIEQHHTATLMTRRILESPVYTAPEQIMGDRSAGPAVDIHALGHVAYELLAGEAYWTEEATADLPPHEFVADLLAGPREAATARAQRRRGRALSPSFDGWFRKATAPNPRDRFHSPTAAVEELANALSVAVPQVQPPFRLGAPTPVNDALDHSQRAPVTAAMRRRAWDETLAEDPAVLGTPRCMEAAPRSHRRGTQRRYRVSVNARTRLLRVKMWGFWDVKEARAYLDEFRREAAPLVGRPWRMVADVSEFVPQRPEVDRVLQETMRYARDQGLREVANVAGAGLSKMHIARLCKDARVPFHAFFASEDEAVVWLCQRD